MTQKKIRGDQIDLTSDPVDGSGLFNVDADWLQGQDGAFYQNANNINAGTLAVARLTGSYNISISGTAADADLLEGSNKAFYQSASNITTGTLNAARLATSGVGAGSYTTADITVDSKGRVTAASNGTSSGATLIPLAGDKAYDATRQAVWNNATGGVVPKMIAIFMVKTTAVADGGYALGNIISVNHTLSESDSGGGPQNEGIAVQVSGTQVIIRVGNRGGFSLTTSKGHFNPTYGRWVFRAYAIV